MRSATAQGHGDGWLIIRYRDSALRDEGESASYEQAGVFRSELPSLQRAQHAVTLRDIGTAMRV